MRNKLIIAIVVAGFILPLTGSSLLEQILEIPPPEPKLTINLDAECLKYQVKWLGIRSAEAWVCTRMLSQNYLVKGYAHTIGWPRKLWRMDSWGEVEMTRDFELVNYTLHDREPFAKLDIFMSLDPQTNVANIKRIDLARSKTTYKKIELYQRFDPVSLASLIRALDWTPGERRYFEFCDGAERYIILFKAGPVETVTVQAGTFKAIRIDPYLFRVPRTKAREKQKTLREIQSLKTWKDIAEYASVWMALDGNRPFVMVRGKAFIGEVYLELVSLNAEMPSVVPLVGK